jgi:hypothetical protein
LREIKEKCASGKNGVFASLVDATLHPKGEFPEITSPSVTSLEVAKRSVRPDGTPYYQAVSR